MHVIQTAGYCGRSDSISFTRKEKVGWAEDLGPLAMNSLVCASVTMYQVRFVRAHSTVNETDFILL